MKNFIGTYECKMDDKGRIKLPSSLVKQMENFGGDSFVVKRSVFQSCLEVYPMNGWEKLMEKINKLNRFQKKNADFIDKINKEAKLFEQVKVLEHPRYIQQYKSKEKQLFIDKYILTLNDVL